MQVQAAKLIFVTDPRCDTHLYFAAQSSIPEATKKRAPEELAVTLLVLRWARVGSRVEPLVCGGGFQLSAVPVHRNGGRRFP